MKEQYLLVLVICVTTTITQHVQDETESQYKVTLITAVIVLSHCTTCSRVGYWHDTVICLSDCSPAVMLYSLAK